MCETIDLLKHHAIIYFYFVQYAGIKIKKQ